MENQFEIKIWSPIECKPFNVSGGTIFTNDNADGTWTWTSIDDISHFDTVLGAETITKVEVVKGGTLTSLENTFKGFSTMTEFIWNGDCNVTNFDYTWSLCGNLTTLPEIDFSKGTSFQHTFENCVNLYEIRKLDFTNLVSGTDTFKGCKNLLYPPTTGTTVRDGDLGKRGTWVRPTGLEITVWSSSDPMPSVIKGGTIKSYGNADGTWTLSSDDGITYISDFNKNSKIERIEVIKGDTLTSLEDTFSNCTNLSSFVWNGTCNVENFKRAWAGCSKLEQFPKMDFSNGVQFDKTWAGCSHLQEIKELDFSNLQSGVGTFFGCPSLTGPEPTGTPVRNGDDATQGTWTLPNKLEIKIWSPTDPSPRLYSGGDIETIGVEVGIWMVTSTDTITHFERLSGVREITKIEVIKGETLTSLENTFRNATQMTEFIWNGDCNVVDFTDAWHGCSKLEKFPQIDVTHGLEFEGTWSGCSALTEFPSLDFSNGLNFDNTWYGCTSLTYFRILDFSNLTSGEDTFRRCDRLKYPAPIGTSIRNGSDANRGTWTPPKFEVLIWSKSDPMPSIVDGGTIVSSESYDGMWTLHSTDEITHFSGLSNVEDITKVEILNATSLTSLKRTFSGLVNLEEFIWRDACNVTDFEFAWGHCSSLKTFPKIDTSKGTNFNGTWYGCADLKSFPNLDVSNGLSFTGTWSGCTKLRSFPKLDVSRGTNFSGTWMNCSLLTEFPNLEVGNGTDFKNTWAGCSKLKTFPKLDFSNGTDFRNTWKDCFDLETFDKLDFGSLDNPDNGINAFAGCNSLVNPLPMRTGVRDQENALQGKWKSDKFLVRVWAPSTNENGEELEPKPLEVEGGAIIVEKYDTESWIWSSGEKITWFSWVLGAKSIRKIEVIRGETLTSLEQSFMFMNQMRDFVWHGACNVENFRDAWNLCDSLTVFPKMDFSHGTMFSGAWNHCSRLVEIKELDFSGLKEKKNGLDTFYGCDSLISPAPQGTSVRDGNDAVKGTWVLPNKLEIIVWSQEDPLPLTVAGGEIHTKWNGPKTKTWTIYSNDPITHFKNLLNGEYITKIQVINGETLTSLESSFTDLVNLEEFLWGRDCNITVFNKTWKGCSKLSSIGGFDFSQGVEFISTWEDCISLNKIQELNFSSLENGTDAFKGCDNLIGPAPTGTSVRNGDEAVQNGIWPSVVFSNDEINNTVSYEPKIRTTEEPVNIPGKLGFTFDGGLGLKWEHDGTFWVPWEPAYNKLQKDNPIGTGVMILKENDKERAHIVLSETDKDHDVVMSDAGFYTYHREDTSQNSGMGNHNMKYTGMIFDQTNNLVRFKVDGKTSIILEEGVAPSTKYAPTADESLIRKDYLDGRLDMYVQKYNPHLFGEVVLDSLKSGETQYVIRETKKDHEIIMSDKGFFTRPKDDHSKFTGMTFDRDTNARMDFSVNGKTSLVIEDGKAPGTKYQPTESFSLTRKDYVDTKLPILDPKAMGIMILGESLEHTIPQYIVRDTTKDYEIVMAGSGFYSRPNAEPNKESGVLLDHVNHKMRLQVDGDTVIELTGGIAPTTKYEPKESGSLTRKDYVDTKLPIINPEPNGRVYLTSNKFYKAQYVLTGKDSNTEMVMSETGFYSRKAGDDKVRTGLMFDDFKTTKLRLDVNGFTSIEMEEGVAPTTQYPPLHKDSLTRKDYVDSGLFEKMDKLNPKGFGTLMMTEGPNGEAPRIVIDDRGDTEDREVVINNHGIYSRDIDDADTRVGMFFDPVKSDKPSSPGNKYKLRLGAESKFSLEINEGLAPTTKYAPTESGSLTRKDYVDYGLSLKLNIIDPRPLGQMIIRKTKDHDPQYIVSNRGVNFIVDDLGFYAQKDPLPSKFYDKSNPNNEDISGKSGILINGDETGETDVVKLVVNDDPSIVLREGTAPITKYQPTESGSLTRKDYVDTKLPILNPKARGEFIITETDDQPNSRISIIQSNVDYVTTLTNAGVFTYPKYDIYKDMGMFFIRDTQAQPDSPKDKDVNHIEFKIDGHSTMELGPLMAPTTKYAPTESGSLTRKDYVDLGLSLKMNVSNPVATGILTIGKDKDQEPTIILNKTDRKILISERGFYTYPLTDSTKETGITFNQGWQTMALKVGGRISMEFERGIAPTTPYSPAESGSLTRKDYVDTKLPIKNPEPTGKMVLRKNNDEKAQFIVTDYGTNHEIVMSDTGFYTRRTGDKPSRTGIVFDHIINRMQIDIFGRTSVTFDSGVAPTTPYIPHASGSLTRKDYVDTKLPIINPIPTGKMELISNKDYKDPIFKISSKYKDYELKITDSGFYSYHKGSEDEWTGFDIDMSKKTDLMRLRFGVGGDVSLELRKELAPTTQYPPSRRDSLTRKDYVDLGLGQKLDVVNPHARGILTISKSKDDNPKILLSQGDYRTSITESGIITYHQPTTTEPKIQATGMNIDCMNRHVDFVINDTITLELNDGVAPTTPFYPYESGSLTRRDYVDTKLPIIDPHATGQLKLTESKLHKNPSFVIGSSVKPQELKITDSGLYSYLKNDDTVKTGVEIKQGDLGKSPHLNLMVNNKVSLSMSEGLAPTSPYFPFASGSLTRRDYVDTKLPIVDPHAKGELVLNDNKSNKKNPTITISSSVQSHELKITDSGFYSYPNGSGSLKTGLEINRDNGIHLHLGAEGDTSLVIDKGVAPTTQYHPYETDSLTRKDYVDTKLPIINPSATGQLKLTENKSHKDPLFVISSSLTDRELKITDRGIYSYLKGSGSLTTGFEIKRGVNSVQLNLNVDSDTPLELSAGVAPFSKYDPIGPGSLTRKDYVDTKLPIINPNPTGRVYLTSNKFYKAQYVLKSHNSDTEMVMSSSGFYSRNAGVDQVRTGLMIGDFDNGKMKLTINGSASIDMKEGVAPTTQYHPYENDSLTRKDYVDTKLPITNPSATGVLFITSNKTYKDPKFIIRDKDVNYETVVSNTGFYTHLNNSKDKNTGITFDRSNNNQMRLRVNGTTSIIMDDGIAPATPHQPTSANQLTRKDYVDAGLDTKLNIINPRPNGVVVLENNDTNKVAQYIIREKKSKVETIMSNGGLYTHLNSDKTKDTGIIFNTGSVEEMVLRVNGNDSIIMKDGIAPSTQYQPTERGSLTRKDYVDAGLDTKLNIINPSATGVLFITSNKTYKDPKFIIHDNDVNYETVMSNVGFYTHLNNSKDKNTGITFDHAVGNMRLRVNGTTSIIMDEGVAPATSHQPTSANQLTRKDYVDTKEPLLGLGTPNQVLSTNPKADGKKWIDVFDSQTTQDKLDQKLNITNPSATGVLFITSNKTYKDPKFIIHDKDVNYETVVSNTGFYTHFNNSKDKNTGITFDRSNNNQMRLRVNGSTSIIMDEGVAPATSYQPTSANQLTRKDYVDDGLDTKLNIINPSATGVLFITSNKTYKDPKFIIHDNDVNYETVVSNTGFYTHLNNSKDKNTGITFDRGNDNQMRLRVNGTTSIIMDEGIAPATSYQPTSANQLTRKDYVDGKLKEKLDVYDPKPTGVIVLKENKSHRAQYVISETDKDYDIVMSNVGFYTHSRNDLSKNTGITFDRNNNNQMRLRVNGETSIIMDAGVAPATSHQPTESGSLTRKDYVDAGLDTKLNIFDPLPTGVMVLKENSLHEAHYVISETDKDYDIVMSNVGFYMHSRTDLSKNTGIVFNQPDGLVRLRVNGTTSIIMDEDVAPATPYQPKSANQLTRKDYVDDKLNTKEHVLGLGNPNQVLATNAQGNGKVWVDLNLGEITEDLNKKLDVYDPKPTGAIVLTENETHSAQVKISETDKDRDIIMTDGGFYMHPRTDTSKNTGITFDHVVGNMRLRVNGSTSIIMDEGVAPATSHQPTSANQLTRKDYVDTLTADVPTNTQAIKDMVQRIDGVEITWDELVEKQKAGNVEVWDRYIITDQNNLKIEIKLQSPSGNSFFDVVDDSGLVILKQIK